MFIARHCQLTRTRVDGVLLSSIRVLRQLRAIVVLILVNINWNVMHQLNPLISRFFLFL